MRFYLLIVTLLFALVASGAVSAAENSTKLYDDNGAFMHSYDTFQDAYNAADTGDSTHRYTIELNSSETFTLQDFEIKKNLIFNATSGTTTLDGGLTNRLIHVYPGVTVTFYNTVFQNGHAPDGTLTSTDGRSGGAIWNEGTLYLVNCTLTNNQAGDGFSGALGCGIGGHGGAIWNEGMLDITDCAFYNNHAGNGADGYLAVHSNGCDGGNGGAIYSTGTLKINNSELYYNHAGKGGNGTDLGIGGNGGSGGAIYCTNDMIITNGTQIHNNYAGDAGAGGSKWIIGGTGGSGGNGGGIYNSGINSFINDSQITFNYAGAGGSGANGSDGSALLFHYNGYDGLNGGVGGSGGAIYNTGHLEITTSTISNNTAGNGGVGGVGGDAIEGLTPNTGGNGGTGGQGGHAGGIYNSNYLLIMNSTVAENASGSGGSGGVGGKGSDRWSVWPVTVVSGNGGNGGTGGNAGYGAGIYYNGSLLEAISNNLTYNILGSPGSGGAKGSKGDGNGGHDGNNGSSGSTGFGGALYALTSSQSLHFNRILGNTSPDVVAANNVSVDAENNWWGSNTEPSSRVSGNVDYSPWIMLRIFASSGTIHYLSNTEITADLTWNTIDGINPYQQPSGGHIPDGVTADFGVQSGPGYVNPPSSTTSAGSSYTTYSGNGIGTATIYTQVDNEIQTIKVNVEKADTNLVVDSASGVYKGSTTLYATLKNEYDTIIENADVEFYVNGSYISTGNTGSTGVAFVTYSPILLNPAGSPYTIEGKFLGNDYYNGSNSTNQLTVSKANTTLAVGNVTGNPGETIKLTATLKDVYNQPLSGYKVIFKVNGVNIGYGYTNSSGIVTKNYLVNLKGGSYTINASFAGNDYYSASNGNGTLKIPQANLYIKSWASKTNPTLGETICINYQLGNYGPNTAEKTVFKLKIPEGMSYISLKANQGTATYNKSNKTVTWTVGNVKVGDKFLLQIYVKALKVGTYTFKPALSTITYDPNISENIPTLIITVKSGGNYNNNHGEGTVGMQDTGIPVGTLLLAIFAVLAGLAMPKRK